MNVKGKILFILFSTLVILDVQVSAFGVTPRGKYSNPNISGCFTSYIPHYPTTINVSDYEGATDTERIQKALYDVPPEGAVVYIPGGVWEAYNLTAGSRTILMGSNNTILKRPANTSNNLVTFAYANEFAVVNMIFDGGNITGAAGILIFNCSRFAIVNNTFIDISRNAIRVSGACMDFEINENRLLRCNEASIILFGSPGERYLYNFSITHNLLYGGLNNGKIGVAFSAHGIIANNTLMNCEFGIATRGVSYIIIENNTIESCESYAFYLGTQPGDQGSDNIEISQNYVINCSVGILRYYGSYPINNVTLNNNSFLYSREWDIYADFSAIFKNNTITSAERLKILVTNVQFIGTRDKGGQPILPGDVFIDLKIDMRDIGIVGRLFGCTPISDNWIPCADIIGDDIINMEDIAFVAKRYGLDYL
ncbi:MAG: right-handed parallel beta-helix repeat-containing protein [Candidatus Bathyarchaeota archaeon]